MRAREIIAIAIHYAADDASAEDMAGSILAHLREDGYRILAPDELDKVTEDHFERLLRDPAGVLVRALRGGIDASSIRADERDRCVVICNDYAHSFEKAMPLYGAADKDSGRGRQEGHVNAAREIATAILTYDHSTLKESPQDA